MSVTADLEQVLGGMRDSHSNGFLFDVNALRC